MFVDDDVVHVRGTRAGSVGVVAVADDEGFGGRGVEGLGEVEEGAWGGLEGSHVFGTEGVDARVCDADGGEAFGGVGVVGEYAYGLAVVN